MMKIYKKNRNDSQFLKTMNSTTFKKISSKSNDNSGDIRQSRTI